MTEEIDQLPEIAIRPVSERLNKECFCITLDREALCQAVELEVGDLIEELASIRRHLFGRLNQLGRDIIRKWV